MDANEWREECNFISDATDKARNGRVSRAFNFDPECFKRYCEMQRDSATREGFHDTAQYIQHCLDDLEAYVMGTPTFIWALVLISISHNVHGHADGLIKEHIAVYGSEDTCQRARQSWAYYDKGGTMYFCQKEMLK